MAENTKKSERITYSAFLEIYACLPAHSEIEFYFEGDENTYMLIKYENEVSFAKSGKNSEEAFYTSLDELYQSTTIDGVCLKEQWDKIEIIIVNDCFRVPLDLEWLYEVYKREM